MKKVVYGQQRVEECMCGGSTSILRGGLEARIKFWANLGMKWRDSSIDVVLFSRLNTVLGLMWIGMRLNRDLYVASWGDGDLYDAEWIAFPRLIGIGMMLNCVTS